MEERASHLDPASESRVSKLKMRSYIERWSHKKMFLDLPVLGSVLGNLELLKIKRIDLLKVKILCRYIHTIRTHVKVCVIL
jgi:hypothetical protein